MCYLDPVDGTMHRRLPHTPDTSTRSRGNLCLTRTTSIRLAILALLYLWFVSYSARGTTQDTKQNSEKLSDQELLILLGTLRTELLNWTNSYEKLKDNYNSLLQQINLLQKTLQEAEQKSKTLEQQLLEANNSLSKEQGTVRNLSVLSTRLRQESEQDQQKIDSLQLQRNIILGVAGVGIAAFLACSNKVLICQ